MTKKDAMKVVMNSLQMMMQRSTRLFDEYYWDIPLGSRLVMVKALEKGMTDEAMSSLQTTDV